MAAKKPSGMFSPSRERTRSGANGRRPRAGKPRPAWAPSDIDFLIAVSGLDLPVRPRPNAKRKT